MKKNQWRLIIKSQEKCSILKLNEQGTEKQQWFHRTLSLLAATQKGPDKQILVWC